MNRKDSITIRNGDVNILIPHGKRILFIDGELDNNKESIHKNFSFYNERVWKHGIVPKQNVLERIFTPRITDDVLTELSKKKRKDQRKHLLELEERIPISAFWIKITFHNQEIIQEEMFNKIISNYHNLSYIIITDSYTYEHISEIGVLKDIQTSYGIIEAYEISPNLSLFYMPLFGNMDNDQVALWRNVFLEII